MSCVFRLRELLRARLKECGWRDQLKDHCRGELIHASRLPLSAQCMCADVISKKGIGNVTVDSLVEEITPTARGIRSGIYVPDCI